MRKEMKTMGGRDIPGVKATHRNADSGTASLLEHCTETLEQARNLIDALQKNKVEDKLRYLFQYFPELIYSRQEDIAKLIGIRRETVSRILLKIVKEGKLHII